MAHKTFWIYFYFYSVCLSSCTICMNFVNTNQMFCSKCISSLFLKLYFAIISIIKIVKHIHHKNFLSKKKKWKQLINLSKLLSDFTMIFNILRERMPNSNREKYLHVVYPKRQCACALKYLMKQYVETREKGSAKGHILGVPWWPRG